MTEPQSPSYFDQRLADMGITAANNHFVYTDANGAEWTRVLFEEEAGTGNIIIHYHGPDGHHYSFQNGKDKWAKDYVRKRLRQPDGNRKYHAPSGSPNFPYLPHKLIEAYQRGTELPVLIITEGEFKATAGCMAGLAVLGISGIHNWYDPNGTKRLHDDIVRLIERCRVKKVLFLTDADTLQITYKPDKELSERPLMFYSAIKNFREAVMYYMERNSTTLTDVYYGHISIDYVQNGKGLDDLLRTLSIQKEKIVAELSGLALGGNNYFRIHNITDGLNKITKHFGLDSPDSFYTCYEKFIADNEFRYKRLTYRYDPEEKKIVRIRHQDIAQYMRIGCDWFKTVKVPNKYMELEEQIKKWKVAEISRDYAKSYPTFLDDIPKFEDWCNIPAMGPAYNRVHNNCYNLFNPIIHQAAEGSIENTLFFIKHLFGGEATAQHDITGDPFTVAHIDRNKHNNRFSNLVALCQRCHLRHDHQQHIANRKYGRNHKQAPKLF